MKTVQLKAFCDIDEKFSLTIPKSVKEIKYCYSKKCPGLVSLQLANDTLWNQLEKFEICPNLEDICVGGVMNFHLPDIKGISDIFISVNDVLFRRNSNLDECREFLEKISEKANLHAIWKKYDKDVKSKLEESGFIDYFKDCYVVDSFKNSFGRKVMSREYFDNTIKSSILNCYPTDQYSKYEDIVLISDENISYDEGNWFYQLHFDTDNTIQHELSNNPCMITRSFDDILRCLDTVERSHKLKLIGKTILYDFAPFVFNTKYDQYIEADPDIVIEGSSFLFDRVGGRWYERIYIDELINRGGIQVKELTEDTDYLVVDPSRSSDKHIMKCLKLWEKCLHTNIILMTDLEIHFLNAYGFVPEINGNFYNPSHLQR